jgi:hypothetical protein
LNNGGENYARETSETTFRRVYDYPGRRRRHDVVSGWYGFLAVRTQIETGADADLEHAALGPHDDALAIRQKATVAHHGIRPGSNADRGAKTMMDGMGMGMMLAIALFWVLIIAVLVLAVAALIKYLRS